MAHRCAVVASELCDCRDFSCVHGIIMVVGSIEHSSNRLVRTLPEIGPFCPSWNGSNFLHFSSDKELFSGFFKKKYFVSESRFWSRYLSLSRYVLAQFLAYFIWNVRTIYRPKCKGYIIQKKSNIYFNTCPVSNLSLSLFFYFFLKKPTFLK